MYIPPLSPSPPHTTIGLANPRCCMFFGLFFAHTREAWTRRTSLLLENGMEYGGAVCGVRTLEGVRNVVGSGKYREGC
jgi:hypothetical protein